MNLRKEARKANLAKWRAQSPAVIQRPLRFVRERTAMKDDKGNIIDYLPIGMAAIHAARRGDGCTVNIIARELLGDA